MSERVSDTCYLTVGKDSRGKTRGIAVRNMTKNKPRLKAGEMAIKVVVSLPASIFDQVTPEVHIDIPAENVQIQPEVTASPVHVYEGTSEGITATFEDDDE